MGRTIIAEEVYKPADDGLKTESAPETSTTSADVMSYYEDELIKFVSDQVTKMDQKLLFDGETQPPLQLIDKAIMQHEHVMLALTALYEQARWALNSAKESYDEWYAKRFLEIRMEVNKKDEARAKWFKDTEIDYMVTNKYTKERAEMKAKVQIADAKVSLFRRLIDSWSSYAYQLGQLSRNGIAEKNSSDMSDKYEDQDPVNIAQLAMQSLN